MLEFMVAGLFGCCVIFLIKVFTTSTTFAVLACINTSLQAYSKLVPIKLGM